MTKMNPSTTLESKEKKRVRFNDRVKIIEIERVDRSTFIGKEMRDETSRSISDDSLIAFDDSSDTRISASIDSFYGMASSCSSSNVHRSGYRNSAGPNRKPPKLPSMLFNSFPVRTTSSLSLPSSNNENEWQRTNESQRSRSFNSSLSPSAPIRVPSIDEIIDCALTVVNVTPSTLQGRSKHHPGRQQNYVWDDCDFQVTGCKRWEEASQAPPKIPRRKMSATSLKNEERHLNGNWG